MSDPLITTTLPETNDFQIVVNTGYAGEVGRFTLGVEEGRPTSGDRSQCAGFAEPTGVARPGEVVTETLGGSDPTMPDGTSYDIWIIPIPEDDPPSSATRRTRATCVGVSAGLIGVSTCRSG